MKNNRLFWALTAVCAVNFAGHLCAYPSLPQTIPIHWGFDGQLDGWGPKWMALVLAALPFLLLVLFRVIPRLDPKAESFRKHSGIWNGFIIGITLFMALLSWITELAVFDLLPNGNRLIPLLVSGGCGVLFIVLGNYMPRVRQNYTFGCRTPWALADEHTWQRTQRMGGITFVVMGFALLGLALLAGVLGQGGTLAVLLAVVLGGTAWIYLYSYLVFAKKLK